MSTFRLSGSARISPMSLWLKQDMAKWLAGSPW
jgi:hypothetical protein